MSAPLQPLALLAAAVFVGLVLRIYQIDHARRVPLGLLLWRGRDPFLLYYCASLLGAAMLLFAYSSVESLCTLLLNVQPPWFAMWAMAGAVGLATPLARRQPPGLTAAQMGLVRLQWGLMPRLAPAIEGAFSAVIESVLREAATTISGNDAHNLALDKLYECSLGLLTSEVCSSKGRCDRRTAVAVCANRNRDLKAKLLAHCLGRTEFKRQIDSLIRVPSALMPGWTGSGDRRVKSRNSTQHRRRKTDDIGGLLRVAWLSATTAAQPTRSSRPEPTFPR